jgi:hypothetical protein
MRATSSSYTKGFPFEALFDACNVLFGPIPVAPLREVVRAAECGNRWQSQAS